MAGVLSISRSHDAAGKAVSVWKNPAAFPNAYFFARALFPPEVLSRLTDPRFRPSTVGADGFTLEPTWLGWLQRASDEANRMESAGGVGWMEMRTYMASTLLRDTDSVSMANSLEVRVPFLDTPLVEFVYALSDAARRNSGEHKALLVRALSDVLPKEIVGQKKRTFTLPWEHWLRGPLRSRIETSLSDVSPALQPLWKSSGVQEVWQSFLGGRTSWSRPWSLFVLNEWCRRTF
jgi:asparagine synthase (glutamine-hydrolysing)